MAKKRTQQVSEPSDRLQAAKAQLEQELLVGVVDKALSAESGTGLYGFENIVGVGIGEKMSGGQYTGEHCVKVYVVAKAPKRVLASEALVPESVRGIPTDVVATGELLAQPYRGRYRPAPGGVSIGHHKITAGTLGCLAKKGVTIQLLSNNHVLANCNSGHVGDPILQPGHYDGGRVPVDVIARLTQFVPIRFNGPVNAVDCAIAKPGSSSVVTPKNIAFGAISSSPVAPSLNMLVKKASRTTQVTHGRIVDISATVRVGYGTSGWALFQNQIVIVSLTSTPFSAGGDSGSLIMTERGKRPVGLLFAGSATHTVANRIANVLGALGITIYA